MSDTDIKASTLHQTFSTTTINSVDNEPPLNENSTNSMCQSLDSKSATFPSYCLFVAFVTVAASFENGWNIGVTNIPEQTIRNCSSGHHGTLQDCLPMNNLLWGFAVGSYALGGLIGSLLAGHFQAHYGRRNTLIFNTLNWIFGGLLLGIAVHPMMFVVGRVLTGVGSGTGSVVVSTYLGEIATVKSRGALGTTNQLFIVIGILASQLFGLVLSFVPGWRILLALTIIPALFQLFLLPSCVESPRYLVSKHRLAKAEDALQRLRGGYNIENEFREIIKGQDDNEVDIEDNNEATAFSAKKSLTLWQILRDLDCRRMLIICVGLNVIQQLCGINGIIFYSTAVFLKIFGENAKYATIGVGVMNLIMTLVASYLIDKRGRRPLLLTSQTGICISSVLVVVGSLHGYNVLVVVSVLLFVSSFAIGLGPIPYLIIPEILPTHCVSSGGSICLGLNWLCAFLVGLTFPALQSVLGGYTFLVFAVITAVSGFASVFIPETKGRSLEEINSSYAKKKNNT